MQRQEPVEVYERHPPRPPSCELFSCSDACGTCFPGVMLSMENAALGSVRQRDLFSVWTVVSPSQLRGGNWEESLLVLGAPSLGIRTLERLARGLRASGMLKFVTVFFSPVP